MEAERNCMPPLEGGREGGCCRMRCRPVAPKADDLALYQQSHEETLVSTHTDCNSCRPVPASMEPPRLAKAGTWPALIVWVRRLDVLLFFGRIIGPVWLG